MKKHGFLSVALLQIFAANADVGGILRSAANVVEETVDTAADVAAAPFRDDYDNEFYIDDQGELRERRYENVGPVRRVARRTSDVVAAPFRGDYDDELGSIEQERREEIRAANKEAVEKKRKADAKAEQKRAKAKRAKSY